MEARLEIQQLAARYAVVVDTRDLDSLLEPYVSDARCTAGTGHEALRTYLTTSLSRFYRSVHLVCGHAIQLADDPDCASGTVDVRAEHEVGGRWILMALRYDDFYARRSEGWAFLERSARLWYAVDWADRPRAPDYVTWEIHPPAALPSRFATWAPYWDAMSAQTVNDLTSSPVVATP